MSDPRKMPPFGDDMLPFGGGGQMPPSMKQPKQGGMPESNRSNPPSPKPPKSSNNRGDTMAGSAFEKIGEQFLLWNIFRYVKNHPGKAIAEGVCFVAVGAPFLYGLGFGYKVNIPGIGFFTIPSSTLGVAVRTGFSTVGSATLREDGSPIIYPEGVAEIERVGTGVTLEDIEAAEAKKEEEAE